MALYPYAVKIRRTITTTIHVDAINANTARRDIQRYGCAEAVSDFPVTDESMDCVIASVKLIKRGS